MNRRLHTTCFLASAAMHALLFVIICVAPAFLPEKPRANTPVINLVSARELDALLRAAEAPPAPAPVSPPVAPAVVEPTPAPKAIEPPRPIEPVPPPPAPTPKPVEPVKKNEVAKEPPPKPAKVEPRPLPVTAKGKEAPVKKDTKKAKEPEPPAKTATTKPAPPKDTPTKSTIKIADTSNLVSHKADAEAKAKQKADAEERARADAAAKAAKAAQQAQIQRVAKMKSILGGMQGGLSSPVDIHIDAGGGPNAQAFLDYGQMMVRIYEQAWLVPPNLSDTLAVVGVTVTVARNGRVLEWDLRRPSGNSAIDKSVRETLQKVFQFEPFPASFRESQRTFNIDFNLKAKRTTG
ncbi:MAG: cell envelope integrity protein TolA [Limisphaerales bacterium]